ncbi:MAG: MlaC/ttg2D family ABC transporter substrate-binding protein [Gammaproteobacteria bacterium]
MTPTRFVRPLAAALLLMLLPLCEVIAADEKPVVIVKDTVSRVLRTLADDSLSKDEIRSRVEAIASERINFYEMGKRILATNWSKATPEQQKRFVELFRLKLLEAYWQRFRKYEDEQVFYFTSSIDQEVYATVDTVIQSEEIEIPVTYRLKLTKGKWLAYDFIVENVSMVATYRSSFAETIKNKGVDALLDKLERSGLPRVG